MRIIAPRTLRDHWGRPGRSDSEQPLKAWLAETKAADWRTPAAIKEQFGSASILGGGRIVFNIAGNKYRLVVWINFAYRVVYVRFIGTHAEYDLIDAKTI